eukprot:10323-Heterococcus_DN1.PRE.3
MEDFEFYALHDGTDVVLTDIQSRLLQDRCQMISLDDMYVCALLKDSPICTGVRKKHVFTNILNSWTAFSRECESYEHPLYPIMQFRRWSRWFTLPSDVKTTMDELKQSLDSSSFAKVETYYNNLSTNHAGAFDPASASDTEKMIASVLNRPDHHDLP